MNPVLVCAALGAKISGVDDSTFSSTGEAFSSIGEKRALIHSPQLTRHADIGLV